MATAPTPQTPNLARKRATYFHLAINRRINCFKKGPLTADFASYCQNHCTGRGDGQGFGLDERIERKDTKWSDGRVYAQGGS